jgi:hypothetical protein
MCFPQMLEFYAVKPEDLVFPDTSDAITAKYSTVTSTASTNADVDNGDGDGAISASVISRGGGSSWMDQESDKEDDGV